MSSGVRTSNVPVGSSLDHVLGNSNGATVQVPISNALAQAGTAGLVFATLADLNAYLTPGANSGAEVVADGANNGIYRKNGAGGSGSWTKIADLGEAALDTRLDTVEATLPLKASNADVRDHIDNVFTPYTEAVDTRFDEAEADIAAASAAAAARDFRDALSRPGEDPSFFTGTIAAGEPDAWTALDASLAATEDEGREVKLNTGFAYPKRAYAVEPAQIYRLRFVVQRRINPADPSSDAVELGFVPFTGNKNPAAAVTLHTYTTLTVGSGRQEYIVYVSRTAGTVGGNPVTVLPEETRYLVPFVHVYTTTGTVAVQVIQFSDGTSGSPVSIDVTAFNTRLTALESADLPDRVTDVETALGTPGHLVFPTAQDALAATIPVTVDAISTLGYWTVGDGGDASYLRGVDGPGALEIGADFWELVPTNGAVSVTQCGATTTGTAAANTAAFQAAVASGFSVIVPPGVWLVNDTITISGRGQVVSGAGQDATFVRNSSTDKPTFVFPTGVYGAEIRDLTVERGTGTGSLLTAPNLTAIAGGSGIYAQTNCSHCRIRNVTSRYNYNNFSFRETDVGTLDGLISDRPVQDGYYFTNEPRNHSTGEGPNCPVQWNIHTMCMALRSGRNGFLVASQPITLNGSATALAQLIPGRWNQVVTYGSGGYGMAFVGGNPASNATPIHDVQIVSGFCGEDANHVVYLDTYGKNHTITGGMYELGGVHAALPDADNANNIHVTANNTDVFITGIISEGARGAGIYSAASGNTSITGCSSKNNGANSGLGGIARAGIYLDGPDACVTGGQTTGNVYGVVVGASALNASVTGHNFSDNGTPIAAQPSTIIVGCSPAGFDQLSGTLSTALTQSDVTALAVANKLLVFKQGVTYTAAANITFPVGAVYRFEPGAQVNPATGVTLTFQGVVEAAPNRRIFGGLGTVVGIRHVHPEWWGAVSDGTTDDAPAIRAAVACMEGSVGSDGAVTGVTLSGGDYAVASQIVITPNTALGFFFKGQGAATGTRLIARAAWSGANGVLKFQAADSNAYASSFKVEGFRVVPQTAGTGSTRGIVIGDSATHTLQGGNQESAAFEDVGVNNFAECWVLKRARLLSFTRCSAWVDGLASGKCLVVGANVASTFTGDSDFHACQFVAFSSGAKVMDILANASGAEVASLGFHRCIFYYGSSSIVANAAGKVHDIWFTSGWQYDAVIVGGFTIASDGAGSRVYNLGFCDGFYTGGTAKAFHIFTANSGLMTGIRIKGNYFLYTTGDVIEAAGAKFVDISHNQFIDAAGGVLIGFSTCFQVVAACNTSGRETTTNSAVNLVKNITGSNRYAIVNNIQDGTLTGSTVNDAAPGAEKTVTGNV